MPAKDSYRVPPSPAHARADQAAQREVHRAFTLSSARPVSLLAQSCRVSASTPRRSALTTRDYADAAMVGRTPAQLKGQFEEGSAHWDKYGLIVQQSGGTPYKPLSSWRDSRGTAVEGSLRRRAVLHGRQTSTPTSASGRAASVAAALEAAATPKKPSAYDSLLGELVASPGFTSRVEKRR